MLEHCSPELGVGGRSVDDVPKMSCRCVESLMGVNRVATLPSLEIDKQGQRLTRHRRDGKRGTVRRTPNTFSC